MTVSLPTLDEGIAVESYNIILLRVDTLVTSSDTRQCLGIQSLKCPVVIAVYFLGLNSSCYVTP